MDFFDELNADIAKIISKQKTLADAEKARKKSNDLRQSPAVRAEARAEHLEILALIEAAKWSIAKVVALFSEQHCDGCGSYHRVFLQYMEEHFVTSRPTSRKWVRVSKLNPDLPRGIMLQSHTTHICMDCCEEHGFELLGAQHIDPIPQALAPSLNYFQDDINAQTA